jgi:glutamate racemase
MAQPVSSNPAPIDPASMDPGAPILLFDSGVGGLTVLDSCAPRCRRRR